MSPSNTPPDTTAAPANLAHILVVDDEPGMRRMMSRALEREGYKVRTAADGGAALAVLETETLDLIVSDIVMIESPNLQ